MSDERASGGAPDLGIASGVSLELLAAIVDHVAVPVFVKDRDHRFVLVNRALSAVSGYGAREMLGRTDFDFFPAAESEQYRAGDVWVFTHGERLVVEERLTDAAGAHRIIETTKVPLRDAAGEVSHVVGIVQDVTALRRADEALRDTNDALERRVRERTDALESAQTELMRRERLAVVGQLAGAIAHQIRNPLGSIKNAAYLLKLSLAPDPDGDVVQSLAVIHDEVRRANQIITDLLEYARIGPASLGEVSLAYIVEQSLGGLTLPAAVVTRCDVPDDALVVADAEQLQAAVFNLLRGSVEAMSEGGELTLSAQRVGPWWELTLVDTGPGLPDEVRDQLRDPLATQSRRVALGLHLMTGRALVENQGGSFEVSSGEGRGTRFTVRVPASTR